MQTPAPLPIAFSAIPTPQLHSTYDHRGAGVVYKTVNVRALRLPCSTINVDDVPLINMDEREDLGFGKGVAECKPPFSSMGAGGVVKGSSVFRPSFEILGAGVLVLVLVLVLRYAVSRVLDFQIKSSFWSTGGVGVV